LLDGFGRLAALDPVATPGQPIVWENDTIAIATAVLTLRAAHDSTGPQDRERGARILGAIAAASPSLRKTDSRFSILEAARIHPDSFRIIFGRLRTTDPRVAALAQGWAVTPPRSLGAAPLHVVPRSAQAGTRGEVWLGQPLMKLPLQ
jgi:hypothetical protein